MQYKLIPSEESEIIQALCRIPQSLAQEQAKLEALKDQYRRAEARYNYAVNDAYLAAEGSVRERETKSENNATSMKYHDEMLDARQEIGKCEVSVSYLENAFTSARKIASLIEAQRRMN